MAIRSNKKIIASIAVYMIAQLAFNFFVEPSTKTTIFTHTVLFAVFIFFLEYEKKNLREFNLDKLSILLIVSGSVLWGIWFDFTAEHIAFRFITILIGLCVYLKIKDEEKDLLSEYKKLLGFEWNRFKWVIGASITGFFLAILFLIPVFVFIFKPTDRISINSSLFSEIDWITISSFFLYELGYDAIIEETVFRGVIWGYLKRLNCSEKSVWLIQAGLVLLLSISIKPLITNEYPYLFLIGVSIFSLLAGWFVWRSRSLVPGIFFHAIYRVTIVLMEAIITNMSGGI